MNPGGAGGKGLGGTCDKHWLTGPRAGTVARGALNAAVWSGPEWTRGRGRSVREGRRGAWPQRRPRLATPSGSPPPVRLFQPGRPRGPAHAVSRERTMLPDARSRFSSTSRPGRRDACDQTSLGAIISTVAGRRGSRWLFTISSRGRVFLVVQASAPRRRRWRAASRTGRKRLAAQRAPVSSRRGESRVSGGCSAEEDSEPSPGLG